MSNRWKNQSSSFGQTEFNCDCGKQLQNKLEVSGVRGASSWGFPAHAVPISHFPI
jgi:hypothetical protein